MKKTIYIISILLLISLHSYSTIKLVSVSNFAFTPASFTINLGDTVRWVFVSGSHTTSSLTVPSGAASWNAPINSIATSFDYKATVAGSYSYQCNIHAFMQGTFTVSGCPPVSGQISATSPTTFCGGGNSVTLNFNGTVGAALQWKLNGNNITVNGNGSSYSATKSGSYTVLVSNNCGSTFVTNAIIVKVNALPNAVITPGDTVYKCAADSTLLNATTTGSVSYQWLKGNTVIAGATNPTYKTKAPGVYKVIVTKNASGCSKTSKSTRIINNCRELNETIASDFKVSVNPNPANDQITISFIASDKNATYQIVNSLGQVMQQKQLTATDFNYEESISVAKLPAGIYKLLVQTKSGLTSTSFIKQ